jgi:signal peptidase
VSTVVTTPAVRPRRVRGTVRGLLVMTLWASFGFGIVLATVVAAPGLVGRHSLAVLSGSMTPTLRVGDLVIDRQERAAGLRPGDIATFRDPDKPSRLLTHRVVRMRIRRGVAYVVTKGDANTGVERWSAPVDGSVGVVELRIPKLGYAVVYIGGRYGRFGMIALPALLLGLYELRRLWFPKERRDG